MRFGNLEIKAALLVNALLTALYLAVVLQTGALPPASEVFGHGLGIIGFLLMLMTETLYSLRKRSTFLRRGRMVYWLKFHIFTGLVGPYMVLLHTSWKFGGLAGLVLLLTLIVVASGIVGRYIYTAIPRTVQGLAIAEGDLQHQIQEAEAALQETLATLDAHTRQRIHTWLANEDRWLQRFSPSVLLWLRPLLEGYEHWRWWRVKRQLHRLARTERRRLERLLAQRRALRRQRAVLLLARRTLALWHTLHVPLGAILFTLAFVHIGAALYYATLLR